MQKDSQAGQPEFDQKHARWIQHLNEMSGGMDIRGVQIAGTLRTLTRFIDIAVSQDSNNAAFSGPRLGILLRLMGEQDNGNPSGINPTRLSHFQGVKKNTITALIKGLEDQGLVERSVDPADRRGCLIRITPSGRELVRSTSPQRFEFMNEIMSPLSSEEKDQLLVLMDKLHQRLIRKIHEQNQKPCDH